MNDLIRYVEWLYAIDDCVVSFFHRSLSTVR